MAEEIERINLNRLFTKSMISALCDKAELSYDLSKMSNVGTMARSLIINNATFAGFVNTLTPADLELIGDSQAKILVPSIVNNDLTEWGHKMTNFIKTHLNNYHFMCSTDDSKISSLEKEVEDAGGNINPGDLADVKDTDNIVNNTTVTVKLSNGDTQEISECIEVLQINGQNYTSPVACHEGENSIKVVAYSDCELGNVTIKIGNTAAKSISLNGSGQGTFTLKENTKKATITVNCTGKHSEKY